MMANFGVCLSFGTLIAKTQADLRKELKRT
jgi:hypothetical protein